MASDLTPGQLIRMLCAQAGRAVEEPCFDRARYLVETKQEGWEWTDGERVDAFICDADLERLVRHSLRDIHPRSLGSVVAMLRGYRDDAGWLSEAKEVLQVAGLRIDQVNTVVLLVHQSYLLRQHLEVLVDGRGSCFAW